MTTWERYLWSLRHIHTCSGPLHPRTCRCSDRDGKHIRWCPCHSDSLEIQAHRSTGSHLLHLCKWLHSDKVLTGIRLRRSRTSHPGSQQHTDTWTRSQGHLYKHHHSDKAPLNMWLHCPGRPVLWVQGDSDTRIRWPHWRKVTGCRHMG